MDSILKSRDITLLTKVHLVKAMIFPIVMHRCESWTTKKAESQAESWCFWSAVLEKTLASPLDCKEIKAINLKGKQFWIFIGRTMLKLKLQYFGYLMWRTDSLEKTLMLGKMTAEGEGDDRGWDCWIRLLDGITELMDMSLSKLWEPVMYTQAGCATVHGMAMGWTRLNDWTELRDHFKIELKSKFKYIHFCLCLRFNSLLILFLGLLEHLPRKVLAYLWVCPHHHPQPHPLAQLLYTVKYNTQLIWKLITI